MIARGRPGLRLHPRLAALVARGVRAAARRPGPTTSTGRDRTRGRRLRGRRRPGRCRRGRLAGPAGLPGRGARAAGPSARPLGESLSPGVWPLLDSLGHRPGGGRAGRASGSSRPACAGVPTDEERVAVGGRAHRRPGPVRRPAARARPREREPPCCRRGPDRPTRTVGGWRVPIDDGPGRGPLSWSMPPGGSGCSAAGGSGPRPRTVALHARWPSRWPADGPQTGSPRWPMAGSGAPGCPAATCGRWRSSTPTGWRAEQAGPGRLFRRLLSVPRARADAGPAAARRLRCGCAMRRSYRFDQVGDLDSIRVGEAAFGIDPLSSSGVQTAIQTGLAAAPLSIPCSSPDGEPPRPGVLHRPGARQRGTSPADGTAGCTPSTQRTPTRRSGAVAAPAWIGPHGPRRGRRGRTADPARPAARAGGAAGDGLPGRRPDRAASRPVHAAARPAGGFLAGLPVGPLIETVEAAPSLRSALDR